MDQQNLALISPTELFTSSWTMFKTHWKILVLIFIIPSLLMYAGNLFIFGGGPVLAVVALILSVAGIVLSVAMRPAMVDAISRLSINPAENINLKSQYKIGFSYFWVLVLTGLILILSLIGAGVLFMIPALILGIYVSMYPYFLVLEGKKGFAAFTESFNLVRGRWWAVFGRAIFLGVIMVVAYLILAGVSFVFGGFFSIATTPEHPSALSSLLSLILAAFVGPFSLIYFFNLYKNLKATALPVVQSAFKKWMVALMVVGIITTLVAVVAVPTLVFLSAQKNADYYHQITK